MRDLARALSNIKLFHYDESFVAVCDERYGTLIFQLGLLYEAIERAIKAEAENAQLRAVVEAAKATKLAFEVAANYPDKDSLHHYNLNDSFCRAEIVLFEALAELDRGVDE